MDGETWESLRFLLNITNWFLNIRFMHKSTKSMFSLVCEWKKVILHCRMTDFPKQNWVTKLTPAI